jgi:RING finger/CHY zinc finger protein 1
MVAHDTITCPVCLRCILAPAQREQLWRAMDAAVRDTPMPAEYAATRCAVLCNDCGARSSVAFHVVGHKCGGCGGYNTRRVGSEE